MNDSDRRRLAAASWLKEGRDAVQDRRRDLPLARERNLRPKTVFAEKERFRLLFPDSSPIHLRAVHHHQVETLPLELLPAPLFG